MARTLVHHCLPLLWPLQTIMLGTASPAAGANGCRLAGTQAAGGQAEKGGLEVGMVLQKFKKGDASVKGFAKDASGMDEARSTCRRRRPFPSPSVPLRRQLRAQCLPPSRRCLMRTRRPSSRLRSRLLARRSPWSLSGCVVGCSPCSLNAVLAPAPPHECSGALVPGARRSPSSLRFVARAGARVPAACGHHCLLLLLPRRTEYGRSPWQQTAKVPPAGARQRPSSCRCAGGWRPGREGWTGGGHGAGQV